MHSGAQIAPAGDSSADEAARVAAAEAAKKADKNVKSIATTFAPRASGNTGKNPAVKGTVLYTVFDVQAWACMAIGGLLSFNVLFPSDQPDIWRLMGCALIARRVAVACMITRTDDACQIDSYSCATETPCARACKHVRMSDNDCCAQRRAAPACMEGISACAFLLKAITGVVATLRLHCRMWSIWMFTIPSLRARDCTPPEKDWLNYSFLVVPLVNIALPFVWKNFAFVFSADCAVLLVLYLWKVVLYEQQKASEASS